MPFRLPSFSAMARHAFPHVLEGSVIPIALFYAGYVLYGLWGGLAASLIWSYGAVGFRMLRRMPVGGLLILSLLALTVRAGLSLATDSVFLYFLQPTLGTLATAAAFGLSALFGKPLTYRLSADLVKLPAHVQEHPAIRRLHVRLSLLWALTFAVNGGTALWLLASQSVGAFLILKSAANLAVFVGAVALSTYLFLRCVRRHQVGHKLATATT